MYAFGSHEWLTYLKWEPMREASSAVPSPNSTTMTLARPRARLRASRSVMSSPPSSPSFLLAGTLAEANSPRPWMRLRPTLKLKVFKRGNYSRRSRRHQGAGFTLWRDYAALNHQPVRESLWQGRLKYTRSVRIEEIH